MTCPVSACTPGNLKDLIDTWHISGVTTNPSIFQAALKDGASYQKQLDELAARGATVDDTVREVTTDDVRDACDLFTGIFQATGHIDGRVSIEVDPRLAHQTQATIDQAGELHKIVDRPNVLIKIPATQAGLPAITAVIAEGISVNVTLIFSLDRYRAVMDAYLTGLEQATEAGHDLREIHSVASFFVSRVDTEIDKRLQAIGLAGNRRAARPGRHRQRPAGLPGVRADVHRYTGGRPWKPRARTSSDHCGRPPGSRTPSTTTPGTSSNSSPPARSTPPRRRPSPRSPTTA